MNVARISMVPIVLILALIVACMVSVIMALMEMGNAIAPALDGLENIAINVMLTFLDLFAFHVSLVDRMGCVMIPLMEMGNANATQGGVE